MKKLLLAILFVVGAGIAVIYLAGGTLIERYSRDHLEMVVGAASGPGFDLQKLTFSGTTINGVKTVTWHDLAGSFSIDAAAPINRKRTFDFTVETLSIAPYDFSFRDLVLTLRGMTVRVRSDTGSRAQSSAQTLTQEVADASAISAEQLTGDTLQLVVPFTPPHIRPSANALKNAIRSLVQSGSTSTDFDFTGRVELKTSKGERTVHIRTTHSEERHTVVVDEDDLRKLSELFTDPLTAGEIRIISRYPVQTPLFVGIRHRAEKSADARRADDPSVPYDAYRMVLWSYLLTRQFGEALAKSVTDAHEEDAGQPLNERNMDLKNASIGRSYAKRGEKEDAILNLVKTDPAVVRSATR